MYYLSTVHSTSIAGDISQCISRQAASTDMVLPCFTGSSKVWLISEMREFCGREKLALQGLSGEHLTRQASDKLLGNLAGNSFNAACVMLVLCSVMQVVNQP